ncbi:MAG: GNAT family N-acetyltransferase [Hyphomicrobiales bacterium]|nr:GNAT family N-acetyltransferase [Hyphomicrobiales bacterium]
MSHFGLFAACFPDQSSPAYRAADAGFAGSDELTGHRLRTDVIVDIAGLEAIADEWRALEKHQAGMPVPFNRYDWVRRVAECFTASEQRRLRIVTLRERGRLVLALPLMTETTAAGIVVGSWLGAPLCKYGDCLAADMLNVGSAVQAAVNEIRSWGTVDALLLRGIRADAVCNSAIRSFASVVKTQAAPFVDLTHYSDIASFRATLNAKTEKSRWRARKKLEAAGRVTFEVAPSGSEGIALMRRAIEFGSTWLGDRDAVHSLFSDGQAMATLVDLAAHSDSGLLVSALRLDGEIVAVEAGYRCCEQYFSFLSAINPEKAELNRGNLQIEETIGWCLDRRLKRFDLLAPASDYETSIATGSVAVCDYALPLSLLGRSYVGLYLNGLRPLARRAFKGAPDPHGHEAIAS